MSLAEITKGLADRVANGSNLNATVKFDFGDDGVVFVDGNNNTVSNEDADADCTITISQANFLALSSGDLDPTTAFMMGKLKVKGNMGIAMKLQSLLG
ncbi:SCP2 sterol-binding domain-containing protein [Ferrovibrio sp.]|uniref:SCP2 sterol-binding domain-containing protein n=1 Tax=Ferrovibrio sp. TaxID=1917215 RepID=UPI0025B8FED9|nr:SCP2 sterol-binding domain-containing protein [Ferrovibrio sp.]MBX3456092.1 SCP2 sterol-binding domain-containing protein [Ferrovibrio sp.]